MVGPILGPTLGGYLTDAYNWRWVFLINVPFGILACLGLWTFMREPSRHEGLKFDWTGFAVLSLGLASLQLTLDQGEQQDWFHSTEIIAELVVACLGIYLFIVHLFTTDNPFIPPRIFGDVNFAAGFLIMFAIGMILLSQHGPASSLFAEPRWLLDCEHWPVDGAARSWDHAGDGCWPVVSAAASIHAFSCLCIDVVDGWLDTGC